MSYAKIAPLRNNVVIQPDAPKTETESGFVIPEAYRQLAPMSGIVVKLGDGPERDKRIRARAVARCLAILDDATIEAATPDEAIILAKEEIGRYLRDASDHTQHICDIGQRVIFPMEAGHEIILNEDSEHAVVIVPEDSVLAVYDAELESVA